MPSPSHRSTADFDAFCDATWQPLLLQTFAACGDLAIAQESVQRAFVDAWHHWPRAVWQGADSYVRAAALRRSAWRTRTRAFHRSQRVTREQRATLTALDTLTLQARRAVVLDCLSSLDHARIGLEIGETEERTTALATAGVEGLATQLGIPAELVATRLHGLAGAARSTQRPTSAALREQGVRRRRAWLGGGVVAALVLTVLGGFYVHADSVPVEQLPPALGPELSARQLLEPQGLAPLGDPSRWSVVATSKGTPTPRSRFCQRDQAADPQRLRSYARTFAMAGSSGREVTQGLELSRTERQARAGYRRALGWYGRCSTAQLHVLSSDAVRGLGDDATVLRLRQQDSAGTPLASYAVGLARTGHILTWTAVTASGPQGPPTSAIVASLANAVVRACDSKAAGRCEDKPVATPNPAPTTSEQAGMLAVSDLPAVPGVGRPWRGTDAAPSAENTAATTCDRTDFTAAGSAATLSRTYLTPGAKVPTRFGVSETLGRFQTPTQAKGLIAQVVDRLTTCSNRDPGAKVGPTAMQQKGPHGTSWYLWRVTSDISAKRSVVFWMGVARYGVNVAQVSFVPGTDRQDLTPAAFQALVERTRDRLLELPGAGG